MITLLFSFSPPLDLILPKTMVSPSPADSPQSNLLFVLIVFSLAHDHFCLVVARKKYRTAAVEGHDVF